jgi:predicted nucleic acid-binding protein
VIILDTNVISALMARDPTVTRWLDTQPSASVWTTSVTVYETLFGIEILATGRRRKDLEAAFERLITDILVDRVVPFDRAAAQASSVVAAKQRAAGRPMEIRDVQIAGITKTCNATLATRNTRHFEGIDLTIIDPWSK